MSLTTALGFHPAHVAAHARPAGLRGAGCPPLRTARLRRVAAAEAPQPAPAQGPPAQPGAHGTPPCCVQTSHEQEDWEDDLSEKLSSKLLRAGICLVCAYISFSTEGFYAGCASVVFAFLTFITP